MHLKGALRGAFFGKIALSGDFSWKIGQKLAFSVQFLGPILAQKLAFQRALFGQKWGKFNLPRHEGKFLDQKWAKNGSRSDLIAVPKFGHWPTKLWHCDQFRSNWSQWPSLILARSNLATTINLTNLIAVPKFGPGRPNFGTAIKFDQIAFLAILVLKFASMSRQIPFLSFLAKNST